MSVTCDVVGLLGAKPQAADSKNKMLVKDSLIPVTITLGVARDAGADGPHPDAGHDGAPGADAAGAALDAAGDLGVGVTVDGAKDIARDVSADAPTAM